MPPKALPVIVHPTTEKIYVSVSGATTMDKTKSVQAKKSAAPKVTGSRAAAPDHWQLAPKFEKGGKDDTTYGFMLNHRF